MCQLHTLLPVGFSLVPRPKFPSTDRLQYPHGEGWSGKVAYIRAPWDISGCRVSVHYARVIERVLSTISSGVHVIERVLSTTFPVRN